MQKLNLVGMCSGKLTVISEGPNIGKRTAWYCQCRCGTTKLIKSSLLVAGTAKSCGCSRYKSKRETLNRGVALPAEYWARANMLRRCLDPSHPQYINYGGRGINIDPRWIESYANFIADLGPKPSRYHSLERLDNNLGYSKSNCKWATRLEQVLNRRLRGPKSTGIVGVRKIRNRYQARIKVNYREIYLGTFETIEEATMARDAAVRKYVNAGI